MNGVTLSQEPALPWRLRLFWHTETYRWIRAARRRVLEVVTVLPLVVVGAVWEWRRPDTRPLPDGWAVAPFRSWNAQESDLLSNVNEAVNAARAAAWFPILIALAVHLVLRGRLAHTLMAQIELMWEVTTSPGYLRFARKLLLAPAIAMASALYLLHNGYGSWTSRYVPLLVGIALAPLLGMVRDRISRRPETSAGFRVPVRMMLTRRGRRAVRDVRRQDAFLQAGTGWWRITITVDGVESDPTLPDDAPPEVAREWRERWLLRRAREFASVGGARSLAWFIAWAVESAASVGETDTVEYLMRYAEETPGVTGEGAYLAAEATFLDDIGSTEAAARWCKALAARGRTPLALTVLSAHHTGTGTKPPAPSPARLARLAWYGTGHLFPLELANRLYQDWGPARGLAASERLDAIAAAVAQQSRAGLLSAGVRPNAIAVAAAVAVAGQSGANYAMHYAQMVRAHARALTVLGNSPELDPPQAAAAYMTAVEKYTEVKDRGGIGSALAHAALCALEHRPRARPSEAEHAMDLLRFGLGLLDEFRIGLRRPQLRSGLARHVEPLHDAALDILARERQCSPAKKAELALWLMESRRRAARDHALAAPEVPDDPEFAALWEELEQHESLTRVGTPSGDGTWFGQWMAALATPGLAGAKSALNEWVDSLHAVLPPPTATDVPQLLRRVGDGVVLALRTRRGPAGWTVDAVMASVGSGMTLRRSFLPRPEGTTGIAPDPVSVAHNGALALDALEDGDREAVGHLSRNVECNLLAWMEIATAVLPPGLQDALAASAEAGRPPVLLVVPDGPVASLPLAGFPLDRQALLGECALVTYVPSLALLNEPVADAEAVGATDDPTGAFPSAATPGTPPESGPRVVVHLDRNGLRSFQAEERLRDRWAAEVRVTTDRQGLFEGLRHRPAPDLVLISAHGESVPGLTRHHERLPRLADDTLLSATTALGLPWPRTVVLGTCWVNHLEAAFGRDPVSFPMSCLLRGATTVIGPTGPFHDAVASELLAGCAADVLDGTDVWTGLHGRMRSGLRNAFGDPAAPAAGAGLAVWTVRPPVSPARVTYQPTWTSEGALVDDNDPPPEGQRPRSGSELPLAASDTVSSALRHAARNRDAQGVVDTLGLATSIAMVEPTGRWDDFFGTPDSPASPHASNAAGDSDPTTDVLMTDGSYIEATASVATVLHIADLLRTVLRDESLLTQHVMYGLIHAVDSAAHAPLGFGAGSEEQWRSRLSDHAFGGLSLPSLAELASTEQGADQGREQESGTLPDDPLWDMLTRLARRSRKYLIVGAAVATLMLALVLQGLERVADTPGLGVEYRPGNDANAVQIEYLVPGGPADRAGLHVGDLVLTQNPLTTGTVDLLVSAPPGTAPRHVTLHSVIPRCLVTTCLALPGSAQ
ncbi:CHAT domain-containing protein [Streptomyces sp. DvalAA-14]|uniref:CHAT domain-containing protein n=1 Tax=unclassified Streptomyces TaxID=2593676 RepID=UPI00081BAACE|nr:MULTISPECIES: CHAT domain-containing protein [unclassified Streptomyces]MYS24270.1 CHAT domain-containing protein [Streptomyces sp. SID4948]SCE44494.1 CHAT domain-containing protein [Streptomyces sp. DvalAA-14]